MLITCPRSIISIPFNIALCKGVKVACLKYSQGFKTYIGFHCIGIIQWYNHVLF